MCIHIGAAGHAERGSSLSETIVILRGGKVYTTSHEAGPEYLKGLVSDVVRLGRRG